MTSTDSIHTKQQHAATSLNIEQTSPVAYQSRAFPWNDDDVAASSPRERRKVSIHQPKHARMDDHAANSTLNSGTNNVLKPMAQLYSSYQQSPSVSPSRRLSIHSPRDSVQPHIQTDYESSSTRYMPTASRSLAYFSLLLSVLSFSSIGPTFVYLEEHGVQPMQAICWRSQTMVLCLLPMVLIEWLFFTPHTEKQWNAMFVPRTPLPLKTRSSLVVASPARSVRAQYDVQMTETPTASPHRAQFDKEVSHIANTNKACIRCFVCVTL